MVRCVEGASEWFDWSLSGLTGLRGSELANAVEERIIACLDGIVDTGKFDPPDPYMDLGLARELGLQYVNRYATLDLEEEKMEDLRSWLRQVDALDVATLDVDQRQVAVAGVGRGGIAGDEDRRRGGRAEVGVHVHAADGVVSWTVNLTCEYCGLVESPTKLAA